MTTGIRSDPQFENLLEYLRATRGFDFTGYKRSTLSRRFNRRMQQVGVADYASYVKFLDANPEEFDQLFDTILINVTAFFRDRPAWECVRQQAVPRIVEASDKSDGMIRVWSAGCSSGEEPYTIAMVLADALGTRRFLRRTRIYATDVDKDALTKARSATYSLKELKDLPEEFLENYFTHVDGGMAFRADLRKAIVFGLHDLIKDPPMSRLNLVVCRNTLMYLNAEIQASVLSRFHFALKDTGILFLGRAERLSSQTRLFTPLRLEHRVFSKTPIPRKEAPFLGVPGGRSRQAGGTQTRSRRLLDIAFETGLVAEILLEPDGMLASANREARALLSLTSDEFGQPVASLPFWSQLAGVTPRIDQAISWRQPSVVEHVLYHLPNQRTLSLDVRIAPLLDAEGSCVGVSISFRDMTFYYAAQAELRRSQEDLEAANQELQATVEELETTNEELQTTNERLNQRSDELANLNAYLDSILSSVQVAIVVLDRALVIRGWNHKAQDMWGVMPEEAIGASMVGLGIGLPVDRLVDSINSCLRPDAEPRQLALDAVNRRGRSIRRQASCAPMTTPQGENQGVILLMGEMRSGNDAHAQ